MVLVISALRSGLLASAVGNAAFSTMKPVAPPNRSGQSTYTLLKSSFTVCGSGHSTFADTGRATVCGVSDRRVGTGRVDDGFPGEVHVIASDGGSIRPYGLGVQW